MRRYKRWMEKIPKQYESNMEDGKQIPTI